MTNAKCPACGHDKVLWRDVKERLYEIDQTKDYRMILVSIEGRTDPISLKETVFHCSLLDACAKCGCVYVVECQEGDAAQEMSDQWNQRNAP